MCGIFAYVGSAPCAQLLLGGLKRLEYRGYDSAGITTQHQGVLHTKKAVGSVANLEPLALPGTIGLAHTRWATHGEPSLANAHPHIDVNNRFSIAHNGIIENHHALREYLTRKGYVFTSQTDSEVIVHLIDHHYEGDLSQAVTKALSHLQGAYGIVVLSSLHDELVIARKGSPLLIGIGEHGHFVASDASALIEHTREIVYLRDGELARLTPLARTIVCIADGKDIQEEICHVDWDVEQLEKGGYDHFMLKEIYEQPRAIKQAISGRIAKLKATGTVLSQPVRIPDRIIIIACGTSWHAGLVARHYFEHLCKIPTQVEYASELRYSNTAIQSSDLVIAISQSGETADTLEALKMCRQAGASTLGVVNVVGSAISRLVDVGLYLHAGPEIGVASTKAFTTQLTALLLIALEFAYTKKTITKQELKALLDRLEQLPLAVEETLALHPHIRSIATRFKSATNALYLGRGGTHYPVALEGALKLKEISYIHAEGLPAAEMKHGPIALIDKDMPVIILAPQGYLYEKVLSNAQEVQARGGRIIVVSSGKDEQLEALATHTIITPRVDHLLQPIISVIPLQLLAYELAVLKDCNVDKPRNLAKSVTVE